MKIGVIFAIYNCEEYVDECLKPWINLREKFQMILTVTSGRFKPYLDIGIPDKNQNTISKLSLKNLDFLVSTSGDNLLDEDSSRNVCLNYLKPHNCDLIWLVDGDEIYTEGQIHGILDFIEENQDTDAFSVYFKNYTIEYPYFIPPWSRPTIYRNRLFGGIERFYFDSFFSFADGTHGIKDLHVKQIPKHVSFIEHYSWTDREATVDKIRYQNLRYNSSPEGSRCQYEYDDNGIFFSNKFHDSRNIEIPSLHEYPSSTLLNFIKTSYSRKENKINLESELPLDDVIVLIQSLDKNQTYGKFETSIYPGILVWFVPFLPFEKISENNFGGYRIIIKKENQTVHSENIITNIGIR
jgi:hypothetical protein